VVEQLTGTAITATASDGAITVPINLSPWDTQIFAITPK
jgi:hypothetical protein